VARLSRFHGCPGLKTVACGRPLLFPMLEPLLIVYLVVLGLCTGFLAGLLGIGGGMIMVPFITAILTARGVSPDLAVKVAIATSMSTIVFTSISSLRAHHKRGAVRWDIVRGLAPGIVLGAAVASVGVFAVLKGAWLALFFALFVSFSATQMLLDKKPKPSRGLPRTPGLTGAGSVIGFLSGLVGAGGGFASVPFMTWCNVAIHQAVATSAALGLPIALANTVGYVVAGQGVVGLPAGSVGYVFVPALFVIAAASVLMAPLGVKAAHALPVKSLKRVFASVLYLLAAYMVWKAISI
jgi:uncharacterized protein